MAVNDEIFKNLAQYGGGTINERVYNFLGSLGYTGTINDRLGQFEEGGRKGWQGLIKAWGQWAPAQLFSQGQQGVWYEPKPEYLYQDAAGTTPVVADGDPVGYMQDLSGNGNHATQATSAARPIYRTDGVLHWLSFDGVDDTLSGSGIIMPADPVSVLVAGSTTTTTANAGFFTINPSSTDSGTQRAIGIQDAETLKVDARSRDARITTPMYKDSVFEGRFAGSGSNNIDAAVNGGSYTTNTGDLLDTLGEFVIGQGLVGGLVEARVYSIIAIAHTLSQDVRGDVITYMAKLGRIQL